MTATSKASPEFIAKVLDAYDRTKTKKNPKGSYAAAARQFGIDRRRVHQWAESRRLRKTVRTAPSREAVLAEAVDILTRHRGVLGWETYKKHSRAPGACLNYWKNWSDLLHEAKLALPLEMKAPPAAVFEALKSRPLTADELAHRLHVKRREVLEVVERASAAGYNIFLRGERFQVEKIPAQVGYHKDLHLIESDPRGVIRYGVVSDNHIGSKYARLDVLEDLYDFFRREGITRVYNCGNWIDGEARFNRHDLVPEAHGMEGQLRLFAEQYPRRDGITTYFIAGDDHEGWYDGVDIGKRAQDTAREHGREDLRYIGYMEAFIRLKHRKSGRGSVMGVVHPGGGSAYALSYSPQKIVESYQGGEKPAVVNFGHYHKMDAFNYRNVWIQQTGCTQDQTPFMRKKRIEAHVGGVLVELLLDEVGAVTDFKSWMKRYFDRGYYNFQFDRAGPVRKVLVPE